MKRMKIKQNKKAQVGESLQDVVGLIVIAFLLIIFFFLSSTAWGFSQKEIKEVPTKQSIHDQEHVSLYNFLQKQVIITKGTESRTITIAELVKLSEIDPQYKAILDSEVSSAFYNNYNLELLSQKEAEQETIKMGWNIDFTQPILIVTPEPILVDISIFYLPSNEPIFVKLTKK